MKHTGLNGRVCLSLVALALAAPGPASGQGSAGLAVGDRIRIDGQVDASIISIEGGEITALGQGKPVCVAGLRHGEPAICNPAPLERITFRPDTVALERWEENQRGAARLAWAAALGGAAMATVGYALGPTIGFGKISGCTDSSSLCTNPVEDFEEKQRASDQKRGAAFGLLLGATAGALIASVLTDNWVALEPALSSDGAPGLSVGVRVPAAFPAR